MSWEFYTNGRDLFTKTIEKIERDADFNPIKLFPEKQNAKVVSIIPTVSSGRPIVDAKGIPVSIIWNRFKAGDSVPHIADDTT